jgi:hypothetical protein
LPEFVKGLMLSRCFYAEVIAPLFREVLPGVPHSAGLLGPGSEVLGLDTEMSKDHGWGPRVLVFLSPEDLERHREALSQALAERLPDTFMGYPTRFSLGATTLDSDSTAPAEHWVHLLSTAAWVEECLGFPAWEGELDARAWLSIPQQRLLELTAGEVFHDELGLESFRARMRWYPPDVWLYLLLAGWGRIGQEGHLMGRAGIVGDEVGSALIASRLVRDVMRLAFLMERRYAPYAKWFGSLFRTLRCGPVLLPTLTEALAARTWQERESHLCIAYGVLAEMHNALGITEPVEAAVRPFHDRPFRVLDTEPLGRSLLAAIEDPEVLRIAEGPLLGGVDQWSDNTDLLEAAELRAAFTALYR